MSVFSSLGSEPEAPTSDSARGLIIAGVALIALFFVGFGGWAAVATIESAVMAEGEMMVEGNRQPVQHRDGGIVREILVREGQLVEKGRALLRLDTTEAQASHDVLVAQMDGLLVREARLAAESADAPEVIWPEALASRLTLPAIATLAEEERRLFQVRRAAFLGEQELNRQKVAQLRQEVAGTQAQETSRRQQLDLIRQELDGQKELFDKGYARKTRMYELQRAVAGLEGAVSEAQAGIAQTEERIRTTEAERRQLGSRRIEEVAGELKETRQKIAELQPRLDALRQQLARAVLTAPETGHVLGMAITAAGNVIAPGATVLDIIPAADSLTLEVHVRPDDIEDVREGMRAEVHLLAFKDITIPQVWGTVARVSADRLADPRTGAPFYAVRVIVDDTPEFRNLNVRLQPGMPASVLIPGGARSVLNYLIWPLKRQLAGAFREK